MLAPSPLYSDPVHLAPTDPAVIAGPDGSWWMFYTQRRAREPDGGNRWVHGTDIGVARSVDGGLDLGRTSGSRPASIRIRAGTRCGRRRWILAGDRYHMFTSYIPGVPDRWDGHPRSILHHTSTDLDRLAVRRCAAALVGPGHRRVCP